MSIKKKYSKIRLVFGILIILAVLIVPIILVSSFAKREIINEAFFIHNDQIYENEKVYNSTYFPNNVVNYHFEIYSFQGALVTIHTDNSTIVKEVNTKSTINFDLTVKIVSIQIDWVIEGQSHVRLKIEEVIYDPFPYLLYIFIFDQAIIVIIIMVIVLIRFSRKRAKSLKQEDVNQTPIIEN